MITPLIEKFLSIIDQATFQRLMNEVLFHEGHKFIGSPGTAIGKNKTSPGTPDSFYLNGDRYVFCEYTTQEQLGKGTKFYDKLEKDIDHCFNTKKSNIEKSKISKIVLGCTGKILPAEHEKLLEKVRSNNASCDLEVYTIQSLPFSIQRIPGLIDKYIPGAKTAHTAILTLEDFIASTTRGWQPSLSNPFACRELELKDAQQKIQSTDILIINGAQGTGKSKLGVELAALVGEQGYQIRVIIHSPVQLWDHLHHFIEPGKRYVILVDDANKAIANLDYLLSFLQQKERGHIKLILTVRNYKRSMLDPYLQGHLIEELTLESLTEEQLTELLKKSMPAEIILTRQSLERITTVAKGNPRLGLMAKDVLLKNDSLAALSSAQGLYDEYFKQLVQELSILKSVDKLKALGVLSFYQVLDHSHDQPKNILVSEFDIDWDILWETYFSLEQEELVDIFLSEVCKVSDQVLATYCFFKAFIDPDTAVLSCADWIVHHLDKYDRRIQGAMNDLINTFGYWELRDRFIVILNDASGKITDPDKRYRFLNAFWYYRELETLACVENWISSLNQEPIPNLNQPRKSGHPDFSNAYIELLAPFWEQEFPMSSEAMDLGLRLLYRQPNRCFDLLKTWEDCFSIHPQDDEFKFKRQHSFLNLLERDLTIPERRKLAAWVVASIAPQLLEYESVTVRSKGGRKLAMTTVHTVYNEHLVGMRKRVLELTFSVFDTLPGEVCEMLEKYVWGGIGFVVEVYREEIELVSTFIERNFNHETLQHCAIVKTYLGTLKKHGLVTEVSLERFIKSEKIKLIELLTFNYFHEPDYKKVQANKRQEIIAWLKGKDKQAIEEVLFVVREKGEHGQPNELTNALNFILSLAAQENKPLLLHALEYIKNQNFHASIDVAEAIIQALAKGFVTHNELYSLITEGSFVQQKRWTQAFFHGLLPEDVSTEYLTDLVKFIPSIEGHYYAYDLEQYDKFSSVLTAGTDHAELSAFNKTHKNAVTLVCQLLHERCADNPITFDHRFCEKCAEYFQGQIALLKNIYIFQKNSQGNHYDYFGTEFEIISDLDNRFILDYLKATAKAQYNRRTDVEHVNVSCVWKYPAYEAIIDEVIDFIVPSFPSWSSFEHTANFLFKKNEAKRDHESKMLAYISSFIVKNANRPEHLAIIMNVVAYTFSSKSQDYFIQLIEQSTDLDLIRRISFEGRSVSVNSRVPVIDRDIELTKNMISRIKSLSRPQRFAEIVKLLETKISYLRIDRERELKSDFIDSE